jgi:hypothetical protein
VRGRLTAAGADAAALDAWDALVREAVSPESDEEY